MEPFEAYQRRAIRINNVTESGQYAVALADLRALEAEVSSAGLNSPDRQSLMFTLSSVMINIAADADGIDDLKMGVEWATRLLDDEGTSEALIPQAEYNRATGLAAMFEIEETDSLALRVRSSSPAYRLAHLDGLREARMLHRRVGSNPRATNQTRGRALCNLGNLLDESSRWVEAYSAYSDALRADPSNGNAAGNIAELLRRRLGRRVNQRGHLAAVYDHYAAMAQSLRERTIEIAGVAAADRWDALELTESQGHFWHTGDQLDPYQRWIVEHRLALVASVEGLGSDAAQWDSASVNGIVRAAGEPVPGIFGALNVLKAEFLVVRRLAFRGAQMHAESGGRQHPDDPGLYTDTLDGAFYGEAPALLLLAQRSALDVLDKIAVTANEHFGSGLPPSRVEYSNYWKDPRTGQIRPQLEPGGSGLRSLLPWPNSLQISVMAACIPMPDCCATRVRIGSCTPPMASRPDPPGTPSAPSTCENSRPRPLKPCRWYAPPTCTSLTSSTASLRNRAKPPQSARSPTSNEGSRPMSVSTAPGRRSQVVPRGAEIQATGLGGDIVADMKKLTSIAWVIADPSPVTQDSYHRIHAGDRCWLQGCNRPFDPGERVAYTAEIGDRKPVCANHAE
jgi:tetratricopeptide (TPR) repeat protein